MTIRRRSGWLRAAGLVAVAILAVACGPTGGSAAPEATSTSVGGDTDAEAYCTEQGGQLVDRVATSNTNGDPSSWLTLAGRIRLCEFEMGEGDATTRISVDLTTLSSEAPTLAAVAYLSKVPPLQTPTAGSNPAAYQCETALHGAAQWGNTNVSGGWVDETQPVFVVMDLCVFADGSAIDQFGIWYYANGTVRGADLATKFRYRSGPEGLPALYDRVRP